MFKIIVTPQFGDTDALKHINNNVIGNWFELGRNEIFRFFTPNLDVNDWHLIMLRSEYDFLSPLYYGYDVEITSYIIHIGNTSFITYHEAWQNEELKAKGKAVIVCYDYEEKSKKPIPKDIKEKLQKHLIKEWKNE